MWKDYNKQSKPEKEGKYLVETKSIEGRSLHRIESTWTGKSWTCTNQLVQKFIPNSYRPTKDQILKKKYPNLYLTKEDFIEGFEYDELYEGRWEPRVYTKKGYLNNSWLELKYKLSRKEIKI